MSEREPMLERLQAWTLRHRPEAFGAGFHVYAANSTDAIFVAVDSTAGQQPSAGPDTNGPEQAGTSAEDPRVKTPDTGPLPTPEQ